MPFPPGSGQKNWVWASAAVLVGYVLGGWLGLSIPYLGSSASLVWPPSGIALASVMLGGNRLLPAIGLGSLLVNLLFAQSPLWVSLGISFGAIMEAALGAMLLRRTGFKVSHLRRGDVFRFILLGVLLPPIAAALNGPFWLCLSDLLPWSLYPHLALTWWLGDATGILALTTLLLALSEHRDWPSWNAAQALEGLLYVAALVSINVTVFLLGNPLLQNSELSVLLVFILVLWATLRFDHRGACLAMLGIYAFAIWGTASGKGPFFGGSLKESLFRLWVFITISSTTTLTIVALIQERMRALQSSQEAYDRFRLFMTYSPVAAFIKDEEGRYIFGNGTWEGVTGQKFSEAEGKSDCELFDPDLVKLFTETDIETHEKGIYYGTETIRDINGVQHWWGVTKFPIHRTGQRPWTAGVAMDLTEVKRTEENLRQRESELLQAQAIARLGSWTWNPDTGEVRWSDQLNQIFDLEPDQQVNYEYIVQRILPDDRDKTLQKAWKAIEQGEAGFRMEFRIISRGKILHLEIQGTIARDPAGGRIVTGTAQDITDKKWTELELRKATEEAQRLAERAEAASKTKSQFLANMSHEIRTPLNGILASADLLQETKLNEEQRELLEIIEISGKALLELLNDILDFSKIEAGKVELNLAPFDLIRLCTEVFRLFESVGKQKRLKMQMILPERKSLAVVGDLTRVRQILTNVVGNAVKFTQVGSVCFELEVEKLDSMRLLAHFRVTDTGVGIPESARNRLFSKFSQVDPSNTRRFGGSGLGLAISKNLLSLMNGAIDFTSEEGKGTCFRIEIPFVATDSEASEPGIAPQEAHSDQHLRVLLADDHKMNQHVTSGLLHRLGCESRVVDHGALALEWLHKEPFDLVLMDCHMPVMDGFEASRRIRQLEGELAKIPIFALSSAAGMDEVENCRKAGMNGHLSKPVTMTSMAKFVAEFLAARQTGAYRWSTGEADQQA